ncbi:GAG-binding domain-containing protein [Streptococcus suis]|uniref:GAG-binding domain-containing protein n=1 Tax=Streptococcus suis TaxID=1307 RepID=UPI002FC6BAB3
METANKKFRYSIRKFKVGVGSVLIATCLLGAGVSTPTAFAATETSTATETTKTPLQKLQDLVKELETDLEKLNEFPEYDRSEYSFQKSLWDFYLGFGKAEMGRVSTLKEDAPEISRISGLLSDFKNHITMERLTREVAQYRKKYPGNENIEKEYDAHLKQDEDKSTASQEGDTLRDYVDGEASKAMDRIKQRVAELEKSKQPQPSPADEPAPAPKEEDTPAPKVEEETQDPKTEEKAPETKEETPTPAPDAAPAPKAEDEVPAPMPEAPAPKEDEVPVPTPDAEAPKAEEEIPTPMPEAPAPKEEDTPAPKVEEETQEPKTEEKAPETKEETPTPAPEAAPAPKAEDEVPAPMPEAPSPKEEDTPAPKVEEETEEPKTEEKTPETKEETPVPTPDAAPAPTPKEEDSAPKTAVPEVAPKTAEKPKLDFATKERKVEEALPIKEEIRYDASLALGKSYLLQEGKAGKKVSVYQDVIVDGKVVATNLLSETVVEGQNRILVKGSLEMKKEEVKTTPSVQSNPTMSQKGAPSANKATLPATGEQRNNLTLVGLGLAGISLAVVATAINKKSKDQI